MLEASIEAYSTAVIAIVGIVSAFVFRRKTLLDQWRNEFDRLHADFWESGKAAIVRRWIANESEYAHLEEVLQRRLSGDTDLNDLDSSDNKKLELLDHFLSVLLRVRYFGETRMSDSQRDLFNMSFENYWFEKIRNRDLLMEYIHDFWGGFLEEDSTFGKSRSISYRIQRALGTAT